MGPDALTDIIRQAMFTALQIAAPMLLISMVVGFTISVFQSVTQISEMTLTFVPKMLIFALAVTILFPWMLKLLIKYSHDLLIFHWGQVVSIYSYST